MAGDCGEAMDRWAMTQSHYSQRPWKESYDLVVGTYAPKPDITSTELTLIMTNPLRRFPKHFWMDHPEIHRHFTNLRIYERAIPTS
jgi:hypothetical protein